MIKSGSPVSLRSDWRFSFFVRDILKAVRQKLTYHRTRVDFWKAKFDELAKELPTSVSIKDQIKDQLVGVSTAYLTAAPSLQIDPELLSKFNEASAKHREHTSAVEDFEKWEKFLASASDFDQVDLTITDYLYFAIDRLPEDDRARAITNV